MGLNGLVCTKMDLKYIQFLCAVDNTGKGTRTMSPSKNAMYAISHLTQALNGGKMRSVACRAFVGLGEGVRIQGIAVYWILVVWTRL